MSKDRFQSAAVIGTGMMGPGIAGTLARRVAALGAGAPLAAGGSRLTRREREIVGLIDKNLSNKEIATALRIEVATVKNHVHNLLEKLNIRSRVDASRVLRPDTRECVHRRYFARPDGHSRKSEYSVCDCQSHVVLITT